MPSLLAYKIPKVFSSFFEFQVGEKDLIISGLVTFNFGFPLTYTMAMQTAVLVKYYIKTFQSAAAINGRKYDDDGIII